MTLINPLYSFLTILWIGLLLWGAAAGLQAEPVLWNGKGDGLRLMDSTHWGDGKSGTPNALNRHYRVDTEDAVILWDESSVSANALRSFLDHRAGTIRRGDSSAAPAPIREGTYSLHPGATLDLGAGHQLLLAFNGTFNLNGGQLISSGAQFLLNRPTAVVNLNGDFTSTLIDLVGDGTLNLNRGTFTFPGKGSFSIGQKNNHIGAAVHVVDGHLHIPEGTLQFGSHDVASRSGILVFKAGGNGSVSTAQLDFSAHPASAIYFEAGTIGQLSLSGASPATYESLWNQKRLVAAGNNSGKFANSGFQVDGETLSLLTDGPTPEAPAPPVKSYARHPAFSPPPLIPLNSFNFDYALKIWRACFIFPNQANFVINNQQNP